MAAVTVTDTEQLPPAGIVPPLSEKESMFPAMVPVPPQLLVNTEEAATLICPGVVGRVSEKATPVMSMAFGLVRVTVSSAVPFLAIWVGAKLLTAVGAAWRVVVRVAPAEAPFPALPVLTLPVELAQLPATALVVFTVTVQLPPAGMVPPERAREEPLLAAVTVPPVQVVAPRESSC